MGEQLIRISELARQVNRTAQTLRRLERLGKIPLGHRGSPLSERWWTADEVRQIKSYFGIEEEDEA